jgi:hypothetical protein
LPTGTVLPSSVIGDRNVFVVRHQRIVRPEHAAGIAGVKDRGEEIGEVAERHRQLELGLRHRDEMLADAGAVRVLGAQGARQAEAQVRPGPRADLHQHIDEWRGTGARRLGARAAERRSRRRDVEDLVADRDADARLRCGRRSRAKHAIRQVLNGKVAIGRIGAVDKTVPRRIVGLVEGGCHL